VALAPLPDLSVADGLADTRRGERPRALGAHHVGLRGQRDIRLLNDVCNVGQRGLDLCDRALLILRLRRGDIQPERSLPKAVEYDGDLVRLPGKLPVKSFQGSIHDSLRFILAIVDSVLENSVCPNCSITYFSSLVRFCLRFSSNLPSSLRSTLRAN